jgi:hypothetical protein
MIIETKCPICNCDLEVKVEGTLEKLIEAGLNPDSMQIN